MYIQSSVISKVLPFVILLLLRVTPTSASLVILLPRAPPLPDPDSSPLVIDTSPIHAPTKTPFIHPETAPQVTPENFPQVTTAGANAAQSEGWTPRHTLIVAIVFCISLVVIMGLFVVFYIARSNERRRLEEVAARNEKTSMVAKATGSVNASKGLRPLVTAGPNTTGTGRTTTPPTAATETMRTVTPSVSGKVRAVNPSVAGAVSTVTPSVSGGVVNPSVAGSVKTMNRNTVGTVRKVALGRPNVTGTVRTSGAVRATRLPRPEYSWNQKTSAAATLKESEEKQVVFGPAGLKESEEKEVVVVLAPGDSPVEEEQTQWTGTWNRNAGMALSRSEYMV